MWGVNMNKDEIQALLNYNFGDYLKERLDEHDMTLRKLSMKTKIDYTILSKITASRPRKTTYQEFLIIMSALNEEIDDFLDYALKRPKIAKAARDMGRKLTVNELGTINKIVQMPIKQREAMFDMMNCIIDSIIKCNHD